MSRAEPKHTNRLAAETSPYLLQHAHNPVDWFPWGPDALERARTEEKPIFLSIGYAACHWCHVMERESFENEATAALLNESFVAIKVDREERPDLDAIYMDAVQQMTGHGGWPMSVFLTPDGKPFYGGTYFPDQARHGLPSFNDVLAGVTQAWTERRGEVEQAGASLAASIAAHAIGAAPAPAVAGKAEAWMLDSAIVSLQSDFDARNGGWGRAPKFPQPMTIEFLLRQHARSGDERALGMARRSLDAMATGGIYDHLGGGFARYATDATWLVPHFEKMLYDNAQLVRVYLHAWQVTRDLRYAEVVEETLGFVLRELLTTDGGFASSLDADTDGEEGSTYVWSAEEIRSLLGEDAPVFERAYGVSEGGNWEGHNILTRVVTEPDSEPVVHRAREVLFAARQGRPQPGRDDKVLTAWNGLIIAAFADAGAAMDRSDWTRAAERAGDLLLREARDAEGRLRRSWKDGRALQSGVLEDYTHLGEGLLALYEATFDERWFVAARDLADQVLAHFGDPGGGFFDTADDHEALITRPKGIQDNALPSGNAMAATILLKLAALTGDGRYEDAAGRALSTVNAYAHRYPTGFGQWLTAMSFSLSDATEIAILGEPEADDSRALLGVVRGEYRPFSVTALAAGARQANDSVIPLLHDRAARDGHATAYVCRAFACRAPVNEPAELAAQLASAQ